MTLRDDYEHWARSFSRRVGEGWGVFLDAISALVDGVTYSVVSGNDSGTDVTAAELEELTDGSSTTLHSHAVSRCHLSKSSGASQNIGGADGTSTDISWDQQDEISADFTHNTVTNNDRIYFNFDGRVHIKASVSGEQGGANRTTLAINGVMNTTPTIVRAKHRNYSRGSAYGDISLIWDTEINVLDGDYLRIRTVVDDTDAAYTINTLFNECEVIITRIWSA